jgi:tetratricopeptide (TPR) repeat protein
MRRSRIDRAAVLILGLIIAGTTCTRGASLRQARRLYRRKRYEEAARIVREELPRLTGRSRNQGLMLLASLETDADRAIELYRRIISGGEGREILGARLELAKIYYATGEYRSAVTAVSSIPGDGPTEVRTAALYFRALCWKQLGEWEQAHADLRAIDRGSFLDWSYATLAELDMQAGRIGDAIEKYETIAGSHSNPVAGFKLGECYEIQGDRSRALTVYQTLMRQFPESLEAPKAREKIQMIHRPRRSRGDGRRASEGGERADEEPAAISTRSARYTLQFGAFTERGNALRLADELRRVVQDVRIERAESGGRMLFRVRAGRFETRDDADREATRIQDETGYFSKPLPLE